MSTVTSVTKCAAPAALMLLLNAAEPVAASKCYKVFTARSTWSEANNQCGAIQSSTNGKLAQILNPVVQATVEQAVTAAGADAIVAVTTAITAGITFVFSNPCCCHFRFCLQQR